MGAQTPGSERRRGQVLIMTTLVLVPLAGVLGLVTDLGYMHYIKETAQTAAEAAAKGALINFHETEGGAIYTCDTPATVVCSATQAPCPTSITTPTNPIQHGCMYAQAHGFNTAGSVTWQAGTNAVPPDAPGSGTAGYWATFRVIQKVPMLFSAVLGNTSGLVVARSTAVVIGATDCVYALKQGGAGTISVGGTAALTSGCGVFDNSNDPCAISTNGGGTVTAPEYDIVGNACTHAPLTPAANTGVAPGTDPLSGLPAPAAPTYHCDYWNYNSPNNTDVTISPGTYCGGINVGNDTVTFASGTYVLVGGGLSTQSTNSHIVGNGVMFYNTFGMTDHGGGVSLPYAPININANSTVNLSAPTTGVYAGILFFDDRSAPEMADTYGGGSTANYTGTIYAPTADVTLYGNSAVTSQYTLLIANTISLVGVSSFNANYSSLPNGSPIQQVLLVE